MGFGAGWTDRRGRRLLGTVLGGLVGALLAAAATGLALGAADGPRGTREDLPVATSAGKSLTNEALLDSLQRTAFQYFWYQANPANGLIRDRSQWGSPCSIAAQGFGITAICIGIDHGWVTRETGRARIKLGLQTLWNGTQGSAAAGVNGYKGLFYHFLDINSGNRTWTCELSTIDTALLMAGVLDARQYFGTTDPEDMALCALADSLYQRVDWDFMRNGGPAIRMGWKPETGFNTFGNWIGYNEAMILYVIALGSDTHPCDPAACDGFRRGYRWGSFEGVEHLGFAPAFGHQFTQVWLDLRGLQDDFTRAHGIDYFENSRRASVAQRNYALANPGQWRGYGERLWGLSACDGPIWGDHVIDGRSRHFETYWARGASFTEVQDDGTICPDATAGAIAFAPDLVVPLLAAMRQDHGDRLFRQYGFVDALNPTFTRADVKVQHGWVDPEHGWYDVDYLGIGQGAIVTMIENWRTGLIWETLRDNPHIVRGLRRAGFSGGWLDAAPKAP